MKRILICLLLAGAAWPAGPEFSAERYIAHIKFLAAPEMKGRASGSPELEKAAHYIAAQYRADGVKPPAGHDYLQAFEVTTSARLGRGNRLEFLSGGRSRSLTMNEEFVPFNFSSSGKVSGAIVFAGYGITAPEYNYDDYANLDVKDKVVLVLSHEPQEYDASSVFEGKVYTDHAQFYSKAANARRHGARGVILINDRVNHKTDKDTLEKFGRADGPADAGIPFVQVKEDLVEPWFKASGKDLMELETGIDKDLKPRSFVIPGVEVRETVDIERAVKTVHNVAAYVPGETNEYVIIGAHYDHLGLGEQFSLAPSLAGTVHPGADDNASGTAGVLELARYFAAKPKAKRGVLFLNFAGEELGLLGSGYYATHPELPLDKAVTMINLDMIGRVRESKIFVGGAGTGSSLRSALDRIIPETKLKVDYSDNGGYGSSDHTSFTAKQVPVLFFFSGLHGDYHKPSDTWDKIDGLASIQVLQLVAQVTENLDSEPERPTFVRVVEKPADRTASSTAPGGSGYGPNFGSIPDFNEPPTGVRFADVRDGTPAALAGLKAGDIMVKFGDQDIRNLYDFTYALRAKKPGDEVVVEVLRGDKKISARVKLTERK
jgi:hypothetical protein